MNIERVWAVITAYRPDAGLVDAVTALQHQVDAIVVVDDGSGEVATPVLKTVAAHGAHVIRLADNSGIACALNAGIRAALTTGADAVVTFDQDSLVSNGFISALVEAHTAARLSGVLSGPVVPEYFADVRQVHHVGAGGVLMARHAIQSGMLMDRSLLSDLGLMRDDLFIDLVDTEFELRCACAHRPTIAAPGLRLAHSLGHRYERRLFGRLVRMPGVPPVVTLSTPFRYYYRVRNRLVVNRVFWRRQFRWVLRDTLIEIIHYANAWALARPRVSLWQVYRTAARDARRGRMGRMPADLVEIASEIRWAARPVE